MHVAIMGAKLTDRKGLILTPRPVSFGSMPEPEDTIRAAFAARMNALCDDMEIPKVGRQVALSREFQVTNKAARRWLVGEGYPEMAMAVRIADWAGVNLNWLLQGVGPKRGSRVDGRVLVLDEAVQALNREQAADLIDNLRAKLTRIGKLSAEEPGSRFAIMLDAYEDALARRRQ